MVRIRTITVMEPERKRAQKKHTACRRIKTSTSTQLFHLSAASDPVLSAHQEG